MIAMQFCICPAHDYIVTEHRTVGCGCELRESWTLVEVIVTYKMEAKNQLSQVFFTEKLASALALCSINNTLCNV